MRYDSHAISTTLSRPNRRCQSKLSCLHKQSLMTSLVEFDESCKRYRVKRPALLCEGIRIVHDPEHRTRSSFVRVCSWRPTYSRICNKESSHSRDQSSSYFRMRIASRRHTAKSPQCMVGIPRAASPAFPFRRGIYLLGIMKAVWLMYLDARCRRFSSSGQAHLESRWKSQIMLKTKEIESVFRLYSILRISRYAMFNAETLGSQKLWLI